MTKGKIIWDHANQRIKSKWLKKQPWDLKFRCKVEKDGVLILSFRYGHPVGGAPIAG